MFSGYDIRRKIEIEKIKSPNNFAGSCYRSQELWSGAEDRPAYGGQLFSHIVYCALKEYPGADVVSCKCTFLKGSHTDKDITYYVTSHSKAGKYSVEVEIEGRQSVHLLDDTVTVKGTVFLQIKRISKEGEIKREPKSFMRHYFKNINLTDAEKFRKMKSTDQYLSDKLIYISPENTPKHKQDGCIEVRFLDGPCEWMRCVAFHIKHPIKLSSPKDAKFLILSFLSDKYLLETAILTKKELITSKKYCILTSMHSVVFTKIDGFIIDQPFFHTMAIQSVEDNKVICAGKIIQNNKIFAVVEQVGIIIIKSNPAEGQ